MLVSHSSLLSGLGVVNLVNQLVVTELAETSGKVLAILMAAVYVLALVALEGLLRLLHFGSQLIRNVLLNSD